MPIRNVIIKITLLYIFYTKVCNKKYNNIQFLNVGIHLFQYIVIYNYIKATHLLHISVFLKKSYTIKYHFILFQLCEQEAGEL